MSDPYAHANICAECHKPIDPDDWSYHDNIRYDEKATNATDAFGPDDRWPDDAVFHADCCVICKEKKEVPPG